MADGGGGVAWSGRRAVVTLPEHVGAADAAWVGNQLREAAQHGAVTLIVDMSATVRCDQAVAEAVGRAYLRAAADKTELRLVICAPDVGRLISDQGLDRLVPMYMSLEAALADGMPDRSGAGGPRRRPRLEPWKPAQPEPGRGGGLGPGHQVDAAVLRQLVDALDDGIALTGEDGTIVLANRKLAAMFGYPAADLAGQSVEVLVPAALREAHHRLRAAYQGRPSARPMADRARLAGLRSDGTTLPVTITLAPVPTADGQLTLAVVRNGAYAQERDDLVMLLTGAASREAEHTRDLLDRVVASMFHAGICLQGAATLPAEAARERISEALQRLDDTIHEIRHHILRSRPPGAAP